MLGTTKITYDKLRFEMTLSQLLNYADFCNIELPELDSNHRKRKAQVAKAIWNELKERGFA